MPVTDFRQSTAGLFIAVMLGHIILISAQVNSRAGVPLLEVVTFGAFSELQRAAATVTGGVRNAWNGYINLRHVRTENEQLKQQLGELQVQFQQERAKAQRTRELESLLGSGATLKFETIPAGVIGAGPSPDFRTLTIDQRIQRGSGHQHGRDRTDRRRGSDRDSHDARGKSATADRPQRRRRRSRGDDLGHRALCSAETKSCCA